jgi:polygalacturonase
MGAFAAGATLGGPLPVMAAAAGGAAAPPMFDIRRFGAVGDGRTMATVAIQKAIDAAGKAGGGFVLVPPGRYLSGALFLRSNVHVYVAAGATLLASERPQDFPPISGRWEGIERTTHSSLLTGEGLENVSISGEGVLDGQGAPWWRWAESIRALRAARGLSREADNPPEAALKWPRPRLINLIRCQAISVTGLHLQEGPSWHVHLVYCQDVLIEGITLRALDGTNCDGIVLDSCKQVRVANCSIATGSDCLSLKSGYNEDGRRVGLPCEDVVIANCNLSHSHGTGISIGSETAGGIKNVTVANCVITGCRLAICVKSPRGRGGVVESIRMNNLVLDDIESAGVVVTNFFDSVTYDRYAQTAKATPETDRAARLAPNEGTPTIRHVEMTGITMGSVGQVAIVEGLPERFAENVSLRDITAGRSTKGVLLARAVDVSVSGLSADPSEGPLVEGHELVRMELHRLKGRAGERKVPAVRLQNTAGFIHGCDMGPDPRRFVELEGNGNRVAIAGNSAAWPPDAKLATKLP